MFDNGTTTPVAPLDTALRNETNPRVYKEETRNSANIFLAAGIGDSTLKSRIKAIIIDGDCADKFSSRLLMFFLLVCEKSQVEVPQKASVSMPKMLAVNTSSTVQ